LSAQSATPGLVTFTRAVTVAAGVFAPGHLGELTQLVPFELVDDVLERTKTVQRRLRALPSRAGVYFVLALGLFPQLGYARVWGKLTAGLAGLPGLEVACPSEKALRDMRRRLGLAPLKALFEVLAGPLAWPYAPGVSFCGLRTVAFDGCSSLRVPDTARNRAWLGRIRHPHGYAGYPALRLLTLAETGTRRLLGAVIGAAADGDEPALARGLLPLLQPGMLVLTDRAYDQGRFLAAVAGTGAQFLARAKASRSPVVLDIFADGSYLSQITGLDVRVIDAHITVTGADGSRCADRYRLITTLLDHHRFPAHRLVRLYHERWEIESAYYALRHTMLHGHVLRSGDRPGLEQETWALLVLYQLLRRAMTDAAATRPGTDPDRPASPPPWKPPATSSPPPPASPPPPPASPPPSAAPYWPACYRPAGPATAPAQSKTPAPATPATPATPAPAPSSHHRDHHHPHHTAPRQKHQAQPPQTPQTPPRHLPQPAPGPHGHPPRTPLARPRPRHPARRPTPQPANPARPPHPHRNPHPHQPRHLHPRRPALNPGQTHQTLNYAALRWGSSNQLITN
jgi:Insertion element 4 transposase N-terminal/Transposase DDE domain